MRFFGLLNFEFLDPKLVKLNNLKFLINVLIYDGGDVDIVLKLKNDKKKFTYFIYLSLVLPKKKKVL